jgi:hypothetical protein
MIGAARIKGMNLHDIFLKKHEDEHWNTKNTNPMKKSTFKNLSEIFDVTDTSVNMS